MSSLTKCRSFPSADLISNDHLLVAGTLHLRLSKFLAPKRSMRLDLSKKETMNEYQIEVSNRFAPLTPISMDDAVAQRLSEQSGDFVGPPVDLMGTPDSQWCRIKEAVLAAASSKLKSHNKPHKAWIQSQTFDLIEQKRSTQRGSTEFKRLNKEVKLAVKSDREKMLEGICTEMEEATKRHDSKKVFDGLRRLTRRVAPTCTVVKDSDDKVLTDTVKVLERWRGYCEDHYRESQPEAPPTLTPPSLGSVSYEPEPLRHEVENAQAIQKGKACGPDEVTIELLQNEGPEVITALH